ncbi:MAG: DUF1273 family protein [Clostridia bacterium]|nr:DUF1273 family protein [Clostridia bacterium]
MYDNPLSPERIRETAFFTGHRFLPSAETEHIQKRLADSITDAYQQGYRRFFCGCALGFDTLAALQVLHLKNEYPDMILSLAIPCDTQAEKWHEKDRAIYRKIIEQADEKYVLSPYYYQGVMLTRNRFMADRSSLCICYLYHMRGGTASTVRYALKHDHIRIVNLASARDYNEGMLREKTWNYMSTSPSAKENAGTARLFLSPRKQLSMKHISTFF